MHVFLCESTKGSGPVLKLLINQWAQTISSHVMLNKNVAHKTTNKTEKKSRKPVGFGRQQKNAIASKPVRNRPPWAEKSNKQKSNEKNGCSLF